METCRTCAKCDFDNATQWLDLFNSPGYGAETERIHLELSTWKIKIACNDGLPQKICTDCFTKFCTVSAFRLQCMEAQQLLSNIFDKIDTPGIQDVEVFETLEPAGGQSNGLGQVRQATDTSSTPTGSAQTEDGNFMESAGHCNDLDDILPPIVDSNPEVSFRALKKATVCTNACQHTDTADLERDKPRNVGDTDAIDNSSNSASIGNNEMLLKDTNDLDENDLIEELIEELDTENSIQMTDDAHHQQQQRQRQDQNCNTLSASERDDFRNADKDNNESHDDNGDENEESNDEMPNDDPLADNLYITFECKYCYKWKNGETETFQTQHQLLAHITACHNGELPYNCPYCKKAFMDAASRTTHLKDLHSHKMHSCQTCGKKYADKFNLKNHVEKYHSGTDFDCTLCAKSFCSTKSLNYHMKWHNPKEQLKCSYCERLFINQRHLKCHEETHTGFRSQEVCSYCGKYFFHLKTLRWHIYRQHGGEKPYKCARCPEVFISYFDKRLHMLDQHLDNLTQIEKTECMLCHKRYDNEHILKDHMLEQHKENKGAVKIANNKRIIMNKKPKSFSGIFHCEKCDKRFNMKSALERHQAVHSIEGRPHACPQCPKRFKRSQDMKWHLKTHSSEKPNVCDVCGKGFALKYVLTQHRRSHEVLEKNFICSTCGRSYLFEKSLRLHERIHSGKTYYKCDLCSESFVTHIKFKWHMKKMHDEDDVMAPKASKSPSTELPLDDLVNIVIT